MAEDERLRRLDRVAQPSAEVVIINVRLWLCGVHLNEDLKQRKVKVLLL